MRIQETSSRRDSRNDRVATPSYSKEGLVAGIVHFGLGNFHRAHQAVVIDNLLEAGLARDFAICGVGVFAGDAKMRDVMADQDGLYVLELKHPDGSRDARIIGSIVDFLFAPDNPGTVIARLARPEVRIVSLTITEGGYNFDQATGEFDASSPDVQHDVANPTGSRTVFGLIVEGLRARRAAGLDPFTVMSCDNIPGNGHVAKRALAAFARLRDPELADWIEVEVSFPNSMVDRITPATTDADREHVRVDLGIDDAWPVAAEPFFQWVLEDDFSIGRPPYEVASVQIVDDVTPYELMKLRLLDASHQAMCYFGYLAGYRFVHEAMEDSELRAFVCAYMRDESAPSLPPVPGIDLEHYMDTLIDRFSNPEIRDTLARLCAESSDRIPKWLVPVIRENLDSGRSVRLSAAICASWARYAEGLDEVGDPISVVDRLAGERMDAASRQGKQPTAFLENASLFGDLSSNDSFVPLYLSALASLHEKGARVTYTELVRGTGRAGSESNPQAVVFDLGEVLATPPNLFGDLSSRLGKSPKLVESAYWRYRDDYDRGGASESFWGAVLADLELPPDETTIVDIARIDTEAWTVLRPDSLELLRDLSEKNIRVAILSNAPFDVAAAALKSEWAVFVKLWFFSAELGLTKPDPAIYEAVRIALDVPADSIAFIDDRAVNVEAAVAAGWNAHLWASGGDSRAWLHGLGVL